MALHETGSRASSQTLFSKRPRGTQVDSEASRCFEVRSAMKEVSDNSPNHDELLSLFSVDRPDTNDEQGTRRSIEKLLQALLDFGIGPQGQGCVVVRSGRLGACVGTRARGLQWVPAYYTAQRQHQVIDVTGGELKVSQSRTDMSAGNAFLGGFVAGLAAEDGDPFTGGSSFHCQVSNSQRLSTAASPRLSSFNSPVFPNSLDPALRSLQSHPSRHPHIVKMATGRTNSGTENHPKSVLTPFAHAPANKSLQHS